MKQSILVLALLTIIVGVCRGDAPAPQTLFNVNPINISTDGLTEEEATFARALEESVNAVCNATTLRELNDAWRVGATKHALTQREFSNLRKSDYDFFVNETCDVSWEEYSDAFDKAAATLFGKRRGFEFDDANCRWHGIALKSLRAHGDVLYLESDGGYIELMLQVDSTTSKKTISSLRLVVYGRREGVLVQFHPNGASKRKVEFRFDNAPEFFVGDARLHDENVLKDGENSYGNYFNRGVRNFFQEPSEVFGDAIEWDDSGRFLSRQAIDPPISFKEIVPDESTSTADASIERNVFFNALPLTVATKGAVPEEGFLNDHDKAVAVALTETINAFGTSENVEAQLDALSKTIFGAKENGEAYKFTTLWCTVFHESSGYLRLICEKGSVYFGISWGGKVRSIEEILDPSSRRLHIHETIIYHRGRKEIELFGFSPQNGSPILHEWRESPKPKYFDYLYNGDYVRQMALSKKSPEEERLITDFLLSDCPLYHTRNKTHWNPDGTLKDQTIYKEPVKIEGF